MLTHVKEEPRDPRDFQPSPVKEEPWIARDPRYPVPHDKAPYGWITPMATEAHDVTVILPWNNPFMHTEQDNHCWCSIDIFPGMVDLAIKKFGLRYPKAVYSPLSIDFRICPQTAHLSFTTLIAKQKLKGIWAVCPNCYETPVHPDTHFSYIQGDRDFEGTAVSVEGNRFVGHRKMTTVAVMGTIVKYCDLDYPACKWTVAWACGLAFKAGMDACKTLLPGLKYYSPNKIRVLYTNEYVSLHFDVYSSMGRHMVVSKITNLENVALTRCNQ